MPLSGAARAAARQHQHDSGAAGSEGAKKKKKKALEWAHFLRNSKKIARKQLDSAFSFFRWASDVVFGLRAFLHAIRRLRSTADGHARAARHRLYVNMTLRLGRCVDLASARARVASA